MLLAGILSGRPNFPSFEEMKSYICWLRTLQGLKGFLYWQYRAETLGREAQAWGLTTIGGQQTPLAGKRPENMPCPSGKRSTFESS